MAKYPSSPDTTEAKLAFPLKGQIYTTKFDKAAKVVPPEIGVAGSVFLSSEWSDTVVVQSGDNPRSSNKDIFITHVRIPTILVQEETNFEWSSTDIGGRRFESVNRTYVYLRSAFREDSNVLGEAMSVLPLDDQEIPVGIFDEKGYILASRQIVQSGAQLEPWFVVERRDYIKRCVITQLGVDALNGKMLTSTETLYYKGEIVTGVLTVEALFADPTNAYWGLQTDGTQRTGSQLSCDWYSITTETVVGGTFGGGVVTVDAYTTNDDYYWPAVLSYVSLYPWARRDGGQDTYPTVKFDPDAYRGPCLTTITRTWSKTPFTIPKVNQMMPTRMSTGNPYYSLNIAECLHDTFDLTVSSGTVDPVYEYIVQTESFPATNYLVWPATITAYDDQAPFRGGYLRTVRVVAKPS